MREHKKKTGVGPERNGKVVLKLQRAEFVRKKNCKPN